MLCCTTPHQKAPEPGGPSSFEFVPARLPTWPGVPAKRSVLLRRGFRRARLREWPSSVKLRSAGLGFVVSQLAVLLAADVPPPLTISLSSGSCIPGKRRRPYLAAPARRSWLTPGVPWLAPVPTDGFGGECTHLSDFRNHGYAPSSESERRIPIC
ncbi:hypothetical protein VNO77_34955 [Canavalia gladiata]|uniref:Uncharacterized protein n=1 Tax=Canavalia gladiata TaxID=3824 RepID=A0AAN9KH10_CANGL